jgi:hypothetical protein
MAPSDLIHQALAPSPGKRVTATEAAIGHRKLPARRLVTPLERFRQPDVQGQKANELIGFSAYLPRSRRDLCEADIQPSKTSQEES